MEKFPIIAVEMTHSSEIYIALNWQTFELIIAKHTDAWGFQLQVITLNTKLFPANISSTPTFCS